MLNLWGSPFTLCDRFSRRNFLKVGGLALGGLSMAEILRREAAAGIGRSHKSVIMVFLPGGPPHLDMFDLKPDAPVEIRGEFQPIKTDVPGIEICEHLPRLARRMSKCAVIRSIVGCRDEHASDQCFSGFSMAEAAQTPGGRPSLGAFLSRIEGPTDKAIPPFVGLSPRTAHAPWGNPGNTGFLGLAHKAFTPHGETSADMRMKGLTLDRLEDRRGLLAAFDGMRRDLDPQVEALDAFTQRAFDVLTSNKLVNALDVSREDPRVRDRYGVGSHHPVDDGAPCINEHFLMARRLVEVGVRCVTLSYGRWDYHDRNAEQCKQRLPWLDQALSALIDDLADRGMLDDVSIVCWGEFGRTPRINPEGGRDHWPQVSCALLSGGGMKTGQVIGATDRHGGQAKDRPVHMQEVLATLYAKLGIDVARKTVTGPSGRPMYLLEQTDPIKELV